MAIRTPLKEDLFVEEPERALLGSKCKTCGQVYFPKSLFCFSCLGDDLEEIKLSQNGELYTFTISHLPASHFNPPFAIGWTKLPEGIRVFSPIVGWEDQPLKAGMEMELVIDKLWDEDDKEIIGYKFKPVGRGDS